MSNQDPGDVSTLARPRSAQDNSMRGRGAVLGLCRGGVPARLVTASGNS